MQKIFLDANVLLDFLLKRAQYNPCKALMETVIAGSMKAYISPAVLHIVAYWLSKEHGAKKAKEILLTLLEDVTIIDCKHEVALSALQSRIDDAEDALQYFTAVHHKLDYFVSMDKDLKKRATPILPVVIPADLGFT